MVKTKEDLTGRKVGRLTVIKQVDDYIGSNGKHYDQWMCECSCEANNITILRGSNIRRQDTLSCGCLRKEVSAERCRNNRKTNEYSDVCEDQYGKYYIGYASNTNAKFFVDADDFDKIKDYCWNEHVLINEYHRLETKIDKRIVAMSEVLGYKYCDHIDRNTLNNRKYNFRKATAQENNRNHSISRANTSKIIGVGWHKTLCKWQARIWISKQEIHLGYFDKKEDAIRARLLAEQKHFKEFAPQRHLFEEYGIVAKE